jgi:hypothetical protein
MGTLTVKGGHSRSAEGGMKMDRISLLLLIASAMTNALGSTVMKHAYGGDTSILSSGIIAGVFKILSTHG